MSMYTVRFYHNNNPLVTYSIWSDNLYTAIFKAWKLVIANEYARVCGLGLVSYSYERVI